MRPFIAIYAWLLTRLPEGFARINAAGWGCVLWILRRKILTRNLRIAFPDRDAAWVKRIGQTSCRRAAEMGLFSIASPLFSPEEIRRRITLDESMLRGPSSLTETAEGVVLFVPHFTPMEMMTAAPLLHPKLAAKQWVVLFRPLNQPGANTWVKDARERFGMQLVSRREGFGRAMKAVREKQFAIILFDQNTPQGISINFMGSPCLATDLPGIIAQRFGAESRIFWAERKSFWQCRLHSVVLNSKVSAGLTIESNNWLADRLRSSDEACAEWLWAHDRWKHGQQGTV